MSDLDLEVQTETSPLEVQPVDETASLQENEATPVETKTFTQAELDAIVQKRVAKAERASERNYQRSLERQLEIYQSKDVQQAKPAVNQGKPNRDIYTDDVQFIEDLADWKATSRIEEQFKIRERSAQAETQSQQLNRVKQDFNERVAKSMSQYPDFEEIAYSDDLKISQPMSHVIAESAVGPAIAYFLGKNPDESAKIAAMSPRDAVKALGKLEAKFETPTGKTFSTAPAPIKPVVSAKALSASLESASMEEYRKARAKQGARWAS